MSEVKKLRLCYFLSAVMLAIFPSTFLLMPLSNSVSENDARVALALTGAAFWVSGISGYSLLFMAYRLYRHMAEEKKRKIYIFTNMPTKIADISFLAGLIVLLASAGRSQAGDYVVYVAIFVIVLAFNMHLLCSRGLYKAVGRVFKG